MKYWRTEGVVPGSVPNRRRSASAAVMFTPPPTSTSTMAKLRGLTGSAPISRCCTCSTCPGAICQRATRNPSAAGRAPDVQARARRQIGRLREQQPLLVAGVAADQQVVLLIGGAVVEGRGHDLQLAADRARRHRSGRAGRWRTDPPCSPTSAPAAAPAPRRSPRRAAFETTSIIADTSDLQSELPTRGSRHRKALRTCDARWWQLADADRRGTRPRRRGPATGCAPVWENRTLAGAVLAAGDQRRQRRAARLELEQFHPVQPVLRRASRPPPAAPGSTRPGGRTTLPAPGAIRS